MVTRGETSVRTAQGYGTQDNETPILIRHKEIIKTGNKEGRIKYTDTNNAQAHYKRRQNKRKGV